MSIEMLLFDYRSPEKIYFENNDFDCFNIKFFEESLNEKLLDSIPEDILEHVTVISVFVHCNVTERILKRFKNLRIVATRSTGIDHIDVDYCKRNSIAVVNVENYGATAVAEYTLSLILALVRKILPANNYLKDTNKSDNVFLGRNLSGVTLGIIGTGAIGGSVCSLANCMGMKILAYDLQPKKELVDKFGVEYIELNELLARADVITLHLPYTKENYHLISKPEFEKMARKPFIVNTSRGELINLPDLKNALSRGMIAGAGLDVLSCESLTFRCQDYCPSMDISQAECIDELKIVSEIINLENVIITPHIAYETQEAVDYILNNSMYSIMDFFKGGNTDRIV